MTVLRIFLTLFLAQAASKSTEPGSVQGTVVNEYTGLPFPGASVDLMGVQQGKVLAWTVPTDSEGRFRFADVPPGAGYQLVVRGGRIQATAYGQRNWNDPWTQIRVEPGQQLDDIRIPVQPIASIRGRVLDSQGRGLLGARVVALRPVYFLARRTLQGATTAITNSRGDYLFSSMPAGMYYIRVTPQNSDNAANVLLSSPARVDRPLTRADNNLLKEPEGYPVTYFPSTLHAESAKPINLTPGGSADSVDIVVSRVRTGRVRGAVTYDGMSVPTGQVFLQREETASESSWTRAAELREGQFDIRGVLPGSYIVWTRAGQSNARLWSRTSVEIRGGETNFVAVKVAPAADVAGSIRVEDWANTTAPDYSQLAVYLLPDSMLPLDFALPRTELTVPTRSVIPSTDGTFTFRGVAPWDYRVVIAPFSNEIADGAMPARRTYVKSIRNGSTDLAGDGLSVEATFEGSVDIVLASDSGGLDGRVFDESGGIAGNARVVLVPDARHRRDLYIAVSASDTGRFRLSGVTPGRYKVFAWRDAPAGSWFDPDFLGAFEDRAPAVRIVAGGAEYLELNWML